MGNDWIGPALALFRASCELPEGERAAFLDRACTGDAELRRHVEAMLARDDSEDPRSGGPAEPGPLRAALSKLAGVGEPAVPEQLGSYRVVRLIAHGGMGVVYEARQENPRRRVAIKVARTGGATDERARRFGLEAQLLARLDHPGIARIIEAGTTSPESGARPYFVMEFVEGQSLTDHARAHLHTAREKLELMARVCEAVGFAHRHGVIHRDLKPDNVLIDASGTPKVLDFGVAKVETAGGFGADTLRTLEGRIIGTLGYMAPEQLAGRTEGLAPAADVYSLGVLIYELLSGRLPHELDGVTLTRALAVVTTTDAPLIGVIRPEYRGDVEAVVAKALEKEPRHRYADAAALQADLERHLRGEPVLARPAGPLRRLTKWARRKPALAASVFGAVLALLTVAAVLLIKNREVQAALDEFELIADSKRLERAGNRADALWPAREALAGAMEDWIGEFRPLTDPKRLQDRELALASLRGRGVTADGVHWTFEDDLLQLEHDVLAKLVADLRAFDADDGLFARMKSRRELALRIRKATVTDRQADWDAAIDRIQENERYHGLVLLPQEGLVPMGRDPDSGLEEFLLFETHVGDIPPAGHGARDTLRFDGNSPWPATGLVLVLIPGGTFWMGAQNDDESRPNYDENAMVGWEEDDEVRSIEPYFLSKYEMTQGQWERFTGHNPSGPTTSPRKPVNRVSWTECDEVTRRLGLVLPDEEQWEYAARAGTDSAWWTGPDAKSLMGAEIVYDRTADEEHAASWWPQKARVEPAEWLDAKKHERFVAEDFGAAPVGSYRANRFGLFDVSGNVAEWCRNRPGWRHPESLIDLPFRVFRGGSFRYGVNEARVARRMDDPPELRLPDIGLRPAMIIRK